MTRFSEADLKNLGLQKDDDGNYSKKKKVLQIKQAAVEFTPMDIMQVYKQTGMLFVPPNDNKKLLIRFNVDPMGAKRLSMSDRWKTNPNHPDPKKRQRPEVTKYWIYKRQLEAIALGNNFTMPESNMHIVCHIPMAKSWSKKQKAEMDGKPHKQTPDSDNILKGIQDSLCVNDAYIWDVRITKVWARKGSIEIYSI